jgi:P-type Ca2+ transporter type 2C
MVGAVLLTFILQMAVVYQPFLQDIFSTRSLSFGELMLCLFLSTIVFIAIEVDKWIRRRRKQAAA